MYKPLFSIVNFDPGHASIRKTFQELPQMSRRVEGVERKLIARPNTASVVKPMTTAQLYPAHKCSHAQFQIQSICRECLTIAETVCVYLRHETVPESWNYYIDKPCAD